MNITNQKSFQKNLKDIEEKNLHSSYSEVYKKLSTNIRDVNNIILYGPTGIGKYSQSLQIIRKYSKSNLNYEKKISIPFNKKDYLFKISDIHIEIDMELLGCNARTFWNEIYNQIIDIIHIKSKQFFFILCKNFHCIQNDLLENFYDYMYSFMSKLNLIYILITEHISFIPKNILNNCNVISFKRPTKNNYTYVTNHIENTTKISDIKNIKNIERDIKGMMKPNKKICFEILEQMKHKKLDLFKLRENLYEILTFQLDVNECIWDIIVALNNEKYIKQDHFSDLNNSIYTFFHYYNNNYRPIFHLERLFISIYRLIHEL